jgi:prolyl-tRNA synthetase
MPPEEFHTPGRKTIADIAEFTRLPETSQIKSLVMIMDAKPVLALLRGDHQLNEAKLSWAVGGCGDTRAADPAEIERLFGASAGSLGPVGVQNIRILADEALRGRRNMIAGANKDDYHLRHVTPDKDFAAGFHDLRQVVAGDRCSRCGAAVVVRKMIEIGRIDKVGSRYSEAMGVRVLDPAGKEVTPVMGSYGLGIERILVSLVERNHDKDGVILPVAIAPFTVVITPVNFADAGQKNAAEEIYRSCRSKGIDALLDDRDERPGVKFKDADLIGVPWRIVVGKKVPQSLVEVVERRTRTSREVAISEAPGVVAGN